jgi:hypothetical protein
MSTPYVSVHENHRIETSVTCRPPGEPLLLDEGQLVAPISGSDNVSPRLYARPST